MNGHYGHGDVIPTDGRTQADLFIYLGHSAATHKSSNGRSMVELQSNGNRTAAQIEAE